MTRRKALEGIMVLAGLAIGAVASRETLLPPEIQARITPPTTPPASSPPTTAPPAAPAEDKPAPAKPPAAAPDLARNPRLSATTEAGCDPGPDLASGRLDPRVQKVLTLATQHGFELRISCAKTGHSRNVKGTGRVSNHYVWRAVDIDQINGVGVAPTGRGAQLARQLAEWAAAVPAELRPSEIGGPFQIGREPFFTDSGHQRHVHIGWSG